MKPIKLFAVAALTLTITACADTTELFVVVDTDLRLGDEVTAIEVAAGSLSDTHTFEITAASPMPLTFSIVPRGGTDSDDDISISVSAIDESNHVVVGWHALTRFRDGRSLELLAPLARSCMSSADLCGEDMACRNGVCEPLFIDPRELEPSGTHQGRIFEGPSEPRVAPTCESRAAEGESCMPACPCVVDRTCLTGLLTCEPSAEGVVEGCTADMEIPFEGTTGEELRAFEDMCRSLDGALCDAEGRECE